MNTIPFSNPDITNKEIAAVKEVIRSGWLAHGKYSKKLEQLLDRRIALKEEVNPEIVAGIIINIGSVVLDGSLRNKIKEQADRIENEKHK